MDKNIEEIIDGLERLKFFNQRAGRELWHDKPKEVQDKDIANAEATLQKAIDFLAEYGMSTEKRKDKRKKNKNNVYAAAKVIRDYCKDKNYCQKCPFFGWGPLWTRACEFMCTCPAGWKMKKKRCKKEDSSRPAMFLDEEE